MIPREETVTGMVECTAQEAAALLAGQDDILLLTHQNPDGDTLGSAFALWNALDALGKRVRVECPDELPERFDYLYQGYHAAEFEPQFITAVDVASPQLLGELREAYEDRVDLCIDHHPSNMRYAKRLCLRGKAGAACEILWDVIGALGARITPQIATCLYTGIATDTGCFKFSNTTADTHRIAAELFGLGAVHEFINEYLFDTKSKARIAIECKALAAAEFYYEGRVAVIGVSQELIRESGVDESELDGITALPRSIEGVDIGITLREKPDGSQKISIRTTAAADASKLCARFGGGGHARAAGCQLECGYAEAKEKLLASCREFL